VSRPDELDRHERSGDDRERERQELDAGQRRPVPEHPLQVEGHEVEDRGHRRAEQEVVRVRTGDRTAGEQPEPDQRLTPGRPLDVDERGQ
jgi:hypothetical protein